MRPLTILLVTLVWTLASGPAIAVKPKIAVLDLSAGKRMKSRTASMLTDVVRTLLLFYLTPVWSTLLGIAFLGERLTRFRLAALILGFTGLLVVLGLGEGFPWPRNMGDWLALFSGLAWAYGSLRLYRTGGLPVFEQVLVFVLGGLAVLVLAVTLGGEFLAPSPASDSLLDVAPHAFAI